tara:strand:+ start:521 stop:694 length:174 start_codon:yes stop_codon:yes gene_type:complete
MKELEKWFAHINAKRTEIDDGITMFTLDSPKETDTERRERVQLENEHIKTIDNQVKS